MRNSRSVVLVASILGLALLPRAVAGGPSVALDEQLRAKAPAIVVVKCVVKIHIAFQGQAVDHEQKVEAAGSMVDPSGIVLLSNLAIGGDSGGVQKARIARMFPGAELTAVPKDVKILVGDDAKEYEATLVARDSQLGLAYLQILGVEAAKFQSLDISKGATPRLGAELFGVTRLERAFDYAPEIRTLYANRKVEQPRLLWGVAGDFHGLGLPAFDASGTSVGVITFQAGTDDGGDRGAFLLPIDAVARSLESARKRVPEAIAQAKAKKEADAKEGDDPKARPTDGPAMGEDAPNPRDPQPPK